MAEGGFATFEESNTNETSRLVAAANANSPAVVLGDNNNGPTNTTVSLISANPNAFALWAAGGLQSASLLLGRYECTYCGRSNPLLSKLSPENDQLFDHILLTSQYHNSVIEVQVGLGIVLMSESIYYPGQKNNHCGDASYDIKEEHSSLLFVQGSNLPSIFIHVSLHSTGTYNHACSKINVITPDCLFYKREREEGHFG